MKVKIKIVNEGQCFGHRGIIVALNNRKVGEGRLVPYGMQHQARVHAESVATRNGWTVVS